MSTRHNTPTRSTPSSVLTVHSAQDIAQHYRAGARPDPSGYYAIPCPAHRGKDANLKLKDAPDGGLVAICWSGGCTYNAILDAFAQDGLTLKRTWQYPGGPSNPGKSVIRRDSPNPQRESDPQARPRSKDMGKNFGPNKGLPLLIRNDSPNALIVITEGESDADAVLSANLDGIAAASFAGGSKVAKDADYSALQGRRVAIWLDNDEVGQGAIEKIAWANHDAEAAEILLIPMVGESGDGLGAADLTPSMVEVFISKATPWVPSGIEPAGASPPGNGAPKNGQFGPSPTDWADLLVAEYPNRFAAVDKTFAVCSEHGLWTLFVDRDRYTKAPIGSLVKREAAPLGVSRRTGPSFYSEFAEGVHTAIHDGQLQTFDLAEMNQCPIIPFQSGSHAHIDVEQLILCGCDVSERKMLNLNWKIPPPDFSLCSGNAPLPAICEQFPPDVFKALARYLLGPLKSMDVLIAPSSDVGKTSMLQALQAALPGAVTYVDSTAILDARRSRFTPWAKGLTESRLVAFDEFGRLDQGLTEHLFNMSGPTVAVGKKGVDMTALPRIGTPFFVGANFPPGIDIDAQGVKQRLGNLTYLEDLDPVDWNTALHWQSTEEVAKLRAWMIRWAKESWDSRDAKPWETDERDELLTRLAGPNSTANLDTGTQEAVEYLREHFEAEDGAWVESKALIDILEDAEILEVSPVSKYWQMLIQTAFPEAEPKRKKQIPRLVRY